jgi:hypothetical protein
MGLAGGCGLFGGSKSAGDTAAAENKLPPDSPAALRQDVDRLRADLVELRTRVETAQRDGTEHADRVAQETLAEFDAVQKAMEASSRNDMQRQVEVLDAQARRIDLLEKRATELGQALRRIELSLGGLESQLSRILDSARPPAPATGARGGTVTRAPAASSPAASRPTEDAPSTASSPDSSMSAAAAGAAMSATTANAAILMGLLLRSERKARPSTVERPGRGRAPSRRLPRVGA